MNRPELPLDLDPRKTALFLDCDGTLAEIAAEPSQARVSPSVLASVRALHEITGGAVAIVSGRSLAQLDTLLDPLILPLAGIHGLQRRGASGRLHAPKIDEAALARATQAIESFAASRRGLICEPKPGSVALHYRLRPDLETPVLQMAAATVADNPPLSLLHGKCVVELRCSHRTKGDAIRDFMRERPFSGRTPIFAGDDETDEAGFQVMPEMGGIGIKIGDGPTKAGRRVGTPAEFHAWLARLAAIWRTHRRLVASL